METIRLLRISQIAEKLHGITITDKGEIEAYSYIIECHEIWKNRIYGFLFGVTTTLIGVFATYLIELLQCVK